MRFLSIAALAASTTARSVVHQSVDQPAHNADLRIPTVHESVVMARRIMHLSSIGTLVTTFPEESQHSTEDDSLGGAMTRENRPPEMAGSPIGLMEYYADCEPKTGNPTLLAVNIATPYKNYAAGSNISLHIRWWPTQKNTYLPSLEFEAEDEEEIPTPHTPAALPRFSLHGHLEIIGNEEIVWDLIPACFLKQHPDSIVWQPGNDIHTSRYMRFVVEHVYWFGGFGDRARIGWLPIDEWRNVTMEEIAAMRLPGESKKKSHKDL